MNITKIVIGGAIGVGMISLISYFYNQTKKLQEACYTIVGAVINEISFNNMNFDLLISISNQSDLSFKIDNQFYSIYVNKMLVSSIENKEKVSIGARNKSTIKINVTFNPQDLLKKGIENITSLLLKKDSLVIEIKGTLSLRAGIVSLKDYQIDERLSMKEL